MTFYEHLATLAPLEEFSTAAFGPSSTATEDERGFFLCLAQIHNDLKDLALVNELIREIPEVSSQNVTPQVGECGGLRNHLFRVIFGVMNELLYLIRSHSAVVEGDLFKSIYTNLPKKAQESWDEIVSAVDGDKVVADFAKRLVRIRKAISFHYDTNDILQGYQKAFSQSHYGTPKVSRGKNMQQSRFFFADAASQALLLDIVETSSVPSEEWMKFANLINHAIHFLVYGFLEVVGAHPKKYSISAT